MSRVAVVVVNYNGDGFVLDCLRSILADAPDAHVVVVDNASTDSSPDRIVAAGLPVALVRNDRNTGFAAAANRGVRASDGPCVVVLNPDAIAAPGSIGVLVRALDEHPKAGAVGALVRNPDGSIQPTKRSFPSLWQSVLHGILGIVWTHNPGTRAYTLADVSLDRPQTVDWVAMTAVALRRDAFEEVGGFDEGFFFFVEDVDLCKRLWDAGFEVWFEPRAEVVHAWGGSWTAQPLRFIWIHQVSLFRYVRKHRRGLWALAYPLIACGLLLRFAMLAIRWLITRRSVPAHRDIAG